MRKLGGLSSSNAFICNESGCAFGVTLFGGPFEVVVPENVPVPVPEPPQVTDLDGLGFAAAGTRY